MDIIDSKMYGLTSPWYNCAIGSGRKNKSMSKSRFIFYLVLSTDLLALLYVMFSCVLSLSHMVSWVRCGT